MTDLFGGWGINPGDDAYHFFRDGHALCAKKRVLLEDALLLPPDNNSSRCVTCRKIYNRLHLCMVDKNRDKAYMEKHWKTINGEDNE